MSLPSHPSDPELDQASSPNVNTNTFTRRSLQKTPTSRYGSGGLSARTAYSEPRNTDQTTAPVPRTYKARNVSPVRQTPARMTPPSRMQYAPAAGGRESPLMQQFSRRALSPATPQQQARPQSSSAPAQRATNGAGRAGVARSIPTPRGSALPRSAGSAHSKLPSPKK